MLWVFSIKASINHHASIGTLALMATESSSMGFADTERLMKQSVAGAEKNEKFFIRQKI